MVRDKNFNDFIASKMEDKVDVSNLQMERNNLREQLRQVEGAKKKLSEQMDKLDVTDRHYNRKYQDMQDRLDNLYDCIDNLEDAIATLSEKWKVPMMNKFWQNAYINLCKILIYYTARWGILKRSNSFRISSSL